MGAGCIPKLLVVAGVSPVRRAVASCPAESLDNLTEPFDFTPESRSEKWVARATRPSQSATRRLEWSERSSEKLRLDWSVTLSPFRQAGRPAGQASRLCYPELIFRTRSEAGRQDARPQRQPGWPPLHSHQQLRDARMGARRAVNRSLRCMI